MTCVHSSRVGTTTSACGASVSCSGLARPASTSAGTVTRSRSGRPKPSVLPVPVLAWPMTSVPERATGSVISWIGKGETIPTASRASAVSGRIPSSRKVVRVLPLLCARCEASAGVVSGPCRDVGCLTDNPRGQAVLHGTTADALALEPLRVPLRTPYATCRTGEEGCRVGADRATDRASSFVRPGEYSAGALPPYPGITHMRWPIWSRSRRHTD